MIQEGSIIKAKEENPYGTTTGNWVGIVTLVEGETLHTISLGKMFPSEYKVEKKYFDEKKDYKFKEGEEKKLVFKTKPGKVRVEIDSNPYTFSILQSGTKYKFKGKIRKVCFLYNNLITDVPSSKIKKDLLLLQKEGFSIRRAIKGGATMQIETPDIKFNHRNKVYAIGSFTIKTNFKKFSNIKISGDHPHIDSQGDCCFGNLGSYLSSLFNKKSYYQFFNALVHMFLSNANPDSCYQDVDDFVESKKCLSLPSSVKPKKKKR